MTSLGESQGARRARHFCALERSLFGLLGGWVSSVAEPEVKILLRAHSFQHAWHAELWAGLLPVGEDESSAVLRPAVEGVLETVAGPVTTAERLSAAYGALLPQLEATYSLIREGLGEAAGGPERRVLDLILADERVACRAGQVLLEALPGGPEDDGRTAAERAVQVAAGAAGGLDATERA